MRVAIVGAGKLGRALARAIGATRHSVRLVPARRRARARFDEALVILAVRDAGIGALAAELAASGRVGRASAVVHLAGAFGPELLSPLAGRCAGVAQAHPMLAFASARFSPELGGGHLLLEGDARAVERAGAIGRAIGLVPRRWKAVDRALYHAAGGLVADGSAAIAAAGARLLVLAGASEREAPKVLGPLLRSVGENVERLGFPAALTGPIRRGDVSTVALHLETMRHGARDLLPVYAALAELQVELAARIGEAAPADLRRIRRLLGRRRGGGTRG
jgi:predicted short-subunit dehydrogenase-like oxidoreductase (DUF2520 family)